MKASEARKLLEEVLAKQKEYDLQKVNATLLQIEKAVRGGRSSLKITRVLSTTERDELKRLGYIIRKGVEHDQRQGDYEVEEICW